MKLGRVLETCLYVDDLEAARSFYADVLGLELFAQAEGRHLFFRAAGGVFLLFNPAATEKPGGSVPPHGARGPSHVAFAVDEASLANWREQLARLGIEVEAEIEWPGGGRSLYFRDPAGNSLELATPQTWGLSS